MADYLGATLHTVCLANADHAQSACLQRCKAASTARMLAPSRLYSPTATGSNSIICMRLHLHVTVQVDDARYDCGIGALKATQVS